MSEFMLIEFHTVKREIYLDNVECLHLQEDCVTLRHYTPYSRYIIAKHILLIPLFKIISEWYC